MKIQRRLSFILTRNVVLLGLGVSLVVGLVRADIILGREVSRISASTNILIKAVAAPAGQAAFSLDPVLARQAVAGLVDSPYVQSVAVVDDFETTLTRHDKPSQQAGLLFSTFLKDKWKGEYTIPLSAHGRNFGRLEVTMNSAAVMEDLRALIIFELLGSLAVFLLVAVLLALVFYRTLTRPLVSLENHLSHIDPAKPQNAALPMPKGHEKNELGALVNGFNTLLGRIDEGILEIQKEQNLLNGLFDSLPIGVTVWDEDGRLLQINEAFIEVTGYTTKDIATLEDWFPLAYPDEEYRELVFQEWSADSQEENAIRQFKVVCRDETVKDIEFRAVFLSDKRAVVTMLDVSDLKQYEESILQAKEEAEQASRSKTLFLGNMSHELRTPLNGVMGLQQLLKTSNLNKEQKKYVELTLQSTRRLTRLLGDILDLTKIESGKMEVFEKPLSISETFGLVDQLFRTPCEQKNIELVLKVGDDMPHSVLGDSVRLQQILNNLVGNAVKFTDSGAITCEAYPLKGEDPNSIRVLFSVTDTGIGIDENNLPKLFQEFTQADEGYKRTYQGAGLGLSIVRQLVALMGGRLSVESELGAGAAFHFSIPFKLTPPAQVPLSESSGSDFSGFNVLVVEDDETSRFIAVKLLETFDNTVHAAEDGRQALELLQSTPCDVVLMDVQLPEFDGVAATKAIRKGEAGAQHQNIPIVAMTAFAMSGDKETFLDAGMDGYVPKPIEADELKTALSNALKKRNKSRQASQRPQET